MLLRHAPGLNSEQGRDLLKHYTATIYLTVSKLFGFQAALHWAAREGKSELLHWLCDAGAEVNIRTVWLKIYFTPSKASSTFFMLCSKPRIIVVNVAHEIAYAILISPLRQLSMHLN